MSDSNCELRIIQGGSDSQPPDLMHAILPETQNRIPFCLSSIYKQLHGGNVPPSVRGRVIPEFIPSYSRYDSNLGLITSPLSPQPQARYSQYVFERLQAYRPPVERRILAQVYAVTTLMAREIFIQPLLHDYVGTNRSLTAEETLTEQRRMAWRTASRMAIDAVIPDPNDRNDLGKLMHNVRQSIDEDYHEDFSTKTAQLSIGIPVPHRETPVEIISSVSPILNEELNAIFFDPSARPPRLTWKRRA